MTTHYDESRPWETQIGGDASFEFSCDRAGGNGNWKLFGIQFAERTRDPRTIEAADVKCEKTGCQRIVNDKPAGPSS